MQLHISDQASATLQEQIRGQIRSRILSGELPEDYALPSIRALARELRVSVITVQRAYDSLLQEHYLYARRGKGFFVRAIKRSDKTELARERFTRQLGAVVEEARRDGLSEVQIADCIATHLQAGDKS